MPILPSQIPTGTILGNMMFVDEDSWDADTDPELTVVSGTVTFTASVPTLRMPTFQTVLVPLSFDCVFDYQGNLVPQNGTGLGVEIPATNSPLISEQGYTWRVDFNLREVATGFTVRIPSFNIQVPVGSTQDLSTLIPVSESTGTITIQGPPGPAGQNGSNIIPTDTAIADNINTEGTQTNEALRSAIIAETSTKQDKSTLDADVASRIASPPSATNTALTNVVLETIKSATATAREAPVNKPLVLIGQGGYYQAPSGRIARVLPDTTKAAGFGSSTMYFMGAKLADMFSAHDVRYLSLGQSGERGEQTVARIGAIPALLTLPGDALPASGAVTVTSTMPTSTAFQTYDGYVNGVLCRLSSSASGLTLTLTRLSAGTATAVAPGTPFLPVLGAEYRESLVVLNLYKNSMSTTPLLDAQQINDGIDATVRWFDTQVKALILLGNFANTGDTVGSRFWNLVHDTNRHCLETYGPLYVDVAAYIASPQLWVDTGITPTPTDLSQQASLLKPSSVSIDSGHFNDAGNTAITALIEQRALDLGYIKASSVDPGDTIPGLLYEYNAASLSLAEGDSVSTWAPSRGAGAGGVFNHPRPNTSLPTYSTGSAGGKPAVKFSAAAGQTLATDTDITQMLQPATFVMVFKSTTTAETAQRLLTGNTSSYYSINLLSTGLVRIDTAVGNLVTTTQYVSGQWCVLQIVLGTDETRIKMNSAATSTLGVAPGQRQNEFIIGSNSSLAQKLNGEIAAMRFYNRALTEAELVAQATTLMTRYGIA